MNDNVIILGAGASKNAGIPLLYNFLDIMWEYSIRGRAHNKMIPDNILKILRDAIDIKNELDVYHGRATFNDRNIEDILSILSFNLMKGNASESRKLNIMIQAIAETIELSCHYKANTNVNDWFNLRLTNYEQFWINLFKIYKKIKSVPCLITFNYDLVLERALYQLLNNKHYHHANKLPGDGLNINYYYTHLPLYSYKVDYKEYRFHPNKGMYGSYTYNDRLENPIDIDYLKLHGSLNFPQKKAPPENEIKAINKPYILPPVFNKLKDGKHEGMWRIALERLRHAKNVIIVGYSLPETDIYMQYFLKTALGPNVNLNRIFVFNPELFTKTEKAINLRKRYASCFSPQFQDRIVFLPSEKSNNSNTDQGTFDHFVRMLVDGNILF